MAIPRFIWGAAAAAALSTTLIAQQAPPSFHQVYCVKVKSDQSAAFAALTNGDLRKLAQYDMDAGRMSGWMVLASVVPQGADARCDDVVVYFFPPGLPPAPMSDADWTGELQKAIGKTPQEFNQELEASGTLIDNAIVRTATQVGAAKQDDYIVVNQMSVPNTGAWIDHEKKMWQPVFEDGVKDGAVDGWAVAVQFMPRGAKDRDVTYTVDIYPNWQSVYTFLGPNFAERWKKIHPDVPTDQVMGEEQKFDTIDHTELYKVVTLVQASK